MSNPKQNPFPWKKGVGMRFIPDDIWNGNWMLYNTALTKALFNEYKKGIEMNNNLITIALNQYGVQERPGSKEHNPVIVNYFKEIGQTWVKDDETAWCSAFVNWVAHKCGMERSGKLDARSWLNVGVNVEKPEIGDVVVFWRDAPTSWKGHVAFFINETDTHVYVLGGNQNNMVNISPYLKSRVLGYRRLRASVQTT